MLVNRSEKLALVHLAKKQCALDDEAYRALLAGSTNIVSASAIETQEQFDAIMKSFAALGFKRLPGMRKKMPVRDSEIPGSDRASRRQLYYIKGLWELASRAKDEASLHAIVKRIGKVDDLRFLTKPAASAVIIALRDICWKAGFNPDVPYQDATGEAKGL